MKKLIIFAIIFFVAEFSYAKPIKMQKAQEKARLFVQKHKNGERPLALVYTPGNVKEDAPLYVFNVGDKQGFVIVAGGEGDEQIMGYADEGEFVYDALPDNLKAWLGGVAHSSAVQAAKGTSMAVTHPTDVIEPMLTTKWGQRAPYNSVCPVSSGEPCPTGCTATALAQVMKYHRYPLESTQSIPQYTTQTLGINMPSLPATTFDWDCMPDELSEDSPQEYIDAVAKLMLYCGQATDMNYTPSGSGAFTYKIPERLPLYFNYPATMHYVYRQSYDEQGWDSLLVSELLKGQPVIYTAYTNLSLGHTFVCDGYDGNGLYHINWGWYGVGNGYYRISVAFATEEGLNDYIKNYHLSLNQTALVGLKPSGIDDYVYPSESFVAYSRPSLKYGRSYLRESVADGFEVTMKHSFVNSSEEMKKLSHGMGLFNEEGTLVAVTTSSTASLAAGKRKDYEVSKLVFGGNIESGHYTLKPIYKPVSSDWRLMGGADRNYVDVNINELKAVLTPMPKADFVVGGISKEDDFLHFDFYNYDEDFYGPVYLRKVDTDNTISEVSYDNMSVEANSRRTFELYIDSSKQFDLEKDIFYLSVDEYDTQYFFCNKKEGDEVLLDKTIEVLNLGDEPSTVIGNRVMCKFIVSNKDINIINTPAQFSLVDNMGHLVETFNIDLRLQAKSDTVIYFDFPISDYSSQYQVVASHMKRANCLDEVVSDLFSVSQGAMYWTKDGELKTMPAARVFNVPDEAVAISLRGFTVSKVTPNANPNTIYMLDKSQPSGLAGKNCVGLSNKTSNLTLTDGYDYFIPVEMSFMQSIAYSRVVKGKGWSTICLPFSPNKVKVDGEEVGWKTGEEDDNGVLRVMQVEHLEKDSMVLSYVEQMEAFKTYLINTDDLQAGSILEFSCGKNTLSPTIQQDYTTTIDEKASLIGSHCLIHQENCFVVENNLFAYHENETEVLPFRGWLRLNGDVAYETIAIDSDEDPNFRLGDLNGDGDVDVTDVMLTVTIVLTFTDSSAYLNRADINHDGVIDVTDVMLLVEMILTTKH